MTRAYEPKGVIPACLLPFDQDLAIDERAYRDHLEDLLAVRGISAITTNAHASEVHALTFEEQRRVLAVTKETLGDRVATVAGVFTNGSLEAARIGRMAQDEGADCILVFPPDMMAWDAHMRPEMAVAHFSRITDATDLPIILFQYPLASRLMYPLPTLLELCERFPQIRAIKDFCGDGKIHERHIRELRELDRPVKVLSTHSAWLMGSLVMGCDGLLSGAGSVIANLQVALFEAVQAGDLTRAQAINDRIYPCTRAFYDAPLVDMHNRMKHALVHLGRLPAAHVRPPLVPLEAAEVARIQRYIDQAGLTPETAYALVA